MTPPQDQIKFVNNALGRSTALCTLIVIVPSFVAVVTGVYKEGVMMAARLYALYFTFGFRIPIAFGEGSSSCTKGVNASDASYFHYCCLRYERLRQQDGYVYGNELYFMLKQDKDTRSYQSPHH